MCGVASVYVVLSLEQTGTYGVNKGLVVTIQCAYTFIVHVCIVWL